MKRTLLLGSLLLVAVLVIVAFTFAADKKKGGGFSMTGAVPAGWYGKSVALVIGIDDYGNGWSPLSAAVRDARKVEQELRRQGFKVYLLVNKQANKADILRHLYDVIPAELSANDRFVLYVSGHGQTEDAVGGQMGYLIPSDGRKLNGQDQFSTYLSMEEIRNVLMKKYRAKHVLIVADACFSGLLTRGSMQSVDVQQALRQDGRMALAAGRQNELAVDGLFTDVFVQGVSGRADANGDGFVTFNELTLYTQQRVTARSDGRQNPMAGPWEGGGQVVFRCGEPGPADGSGAGQTPSSPPPPTPLPLARPSEEGTWTDPSAGLTWQVLPTGGLMKWSAAKSHCEGLSHGGYSDWRLPTISELRSLIRGCPATQKGGSCGVTDSCLDGSCWDDPCSGCSSKSGPGHSGAYRPPELRGEVDWYWSSSALAEGGSRAWGVDFGYGIVLPHHVNKNGIARCVRYGRNQSASSRSAPTDTPEPHGVVQSELHTREAKSEGVLPARFQVRSCGSIVDSQTELEWYVGPDEEINWIVARDWTSALSACGGGWRMPQAFEVATLWMREVESRHLDPAFRTSGSWVWTAEKGTNSVIAPYFNFNTGTEQWFCRECSSPFLRAVAVRARK